jgi:hypothetical protein
MSPALQALVGDPGVQRRLAAMRGEALLAERGTATIRQPISKTRKPWNHNEREIVASLARLRP